MILLHRRIFNFDVENFDYDQYIKNWVIGSRRFLLKLPDENIPEARRKYKIFYFIDKSVRMLFYILIGKFIINKFMW